jgi:predicted O-methyltransferase YrrM
MMRPEDVDGLISNVQGELLREYAKDAYCAVEVGSFRGKSAAFIASGLPDGGRLYCVDPWQDSDEVRESQYRTGENFAKFCHNIKSCGYWDRVVPIRKFSVDAAKGWNRPIDLMHIDGGHDYDEVLADIQAWSPHMKDGSIMLFDDYSPKFDGIEQALHESFDTVTLHNVGFYSKGPRRWFAAAKVNK